MFDSKSKEFHIILFFAGSIFVFMGFILAGTNRIRTRFILRCSDLELGHKSASLFDSPEKRESFVGFDNYRRAFDDPRILEISFELLSLCTGFASSYSFYFLHARGQPAEPSVGLANTIALLLIIPGLAMPSVLSTLFYLFFHGKEGALNQYLIMPLGFKPINWMMDRTLLCLP